MEKILSSVMRLLFVIAFGILVLAVSEIVANVFGYTIMRGGYTGGRLLEFATVFMVCVITLLLRQIRDQLKRS
jgi:hypothetical protein